MKKKIAVLGGGHGAHTMAADLALKGYSVNMCEAPLFSSNIKVALERQAIDLIDGYGEKKRAKLNLVTTDFAEGLKGVDYIMLAIPAMGSDTFFRWILPHLEEGQTIIKWSGNFSALTFARILKEEGITKELTLAESHTLPWGCRLVEPGTAQIMVWVTKLLFATYPANQLDQVFKDVKEMYPVVKCENVLATTLNNLNPVVHPVGTVMNAGWIDTIGENFHFYRDGNTLSISRGIKDIYEEVAAIAEKVGVTMAEYPEEDFWKKSAIMSTNTRAAFDKEGAVSKISGPSSVKSRYITEDLPYGLVPYKRIAEKFSVSTPCIDAVITLSSSINQTDYMAKGLSLESLGIEGLNKSELLRRLETAH